MFSFAVLPKELAHCGAGHCNREHRREAGRMSRWCFVLVPPLSPPTLQLRQRRRERATIPVHAKPPLEHRGDAILRIQLPARGDATRCFVESPARSSTSARIRRIVASRGICVVESRATRSASRDQVLPEQLEPELPNDHRFPRVRPPHFLQIPQGAIGVPESRGRHRGRPP